MLVLGSLGCHSCVYGKVLDGFEDEVICVDTLPLASFQSLLGQLIRLLPILVDESESFLVLFLVLGGLLWHFTSRSLRLFTHN